MKGIVNMFPNGGLVIAKNEKLDLKQVKAKVIGLFFAAIWCPPARYLTPLLVEFYKKYGSSKSLEIVFISADHNEEKFKTYYSEMLWLALPYDQRTTKVNIAFSLSNLLLHITHIFKNSKDFTLSKIQCDGCALIDFA